MFGGSGKLGRGGGAGRGAGGGNKRNIHSTFHNPSLHHRPSSAVAAAAAPPSGGRLSMGGGGAAQRNRVGSGSDASAASSAATEESFRLVTEDPLNFAMIIRLAPDLVEEIKRVESQGSRARIKFDANANNSAGNVISVGGKDFRFTWSRETGDLCDIYEERQSGDDGNGLLVESGSAWRKLNVQRVLDESTKNHVKMRSEEAERKLKSRKAIVLDHGNPSMTKNVKAMVAAESTSSWRMKGAPFKKRKAEPPPGGPPKSVQRSSLTTTPPSKGRPPALSPSSLPEQSVVPGSPVGSNLMKGHTDVEDTGSALPMSRAVGSEKDTTARVSSAGRGKLGQKTLKGAQPVDLRNMLISLLGESHSKGKSLKALEKAVGDAIPNSVKQIEPILKKIATYQAPGRYFLKPGVVMESSEKPPLSEGQRSPEDNHHSSPAQDIQQSALGNAILLRSEANEPEHSEPANKFEEETNLGERVDISHQVADLFGEKKVSDNSEGPVGSSSDSGSDSDSESDSSDSGSDSGTHSRSRSRSAGESGTGSSSDSESDDASTKSKEASDEDVDIMTSDDDKQVKHQLETTAIGSLWGNSDVEHARMDEEKQDDSIEIERDFPEDQPVRGMAASSDLVRIQEAQKAVDGTASPSYYQSEDHEKHGYAAKNYGESGNVSTDGFRHGHSDSSEKPLRGKFKRDLEEKLEDRPERGKKLKSGSSQQPLTSGSRGAAFQGVHQNPSPDRPFEYLTRGPNNLVANTWRREINSSSGSQKSYDQTSLGKPMSDSQPPFQKSIDPSQRVKTSIPAERQGKHSEHISRSSKQTDKLHQATDGLSVQKDRLNRDMPDVYTSTVHKGLVKASKEDFLEKQVTPADAHQRKHEAFGNSKEAGSVLNSPNDENLNFREKSVVNGRPNVLQRELSDLELGELREPFPEEPSGSGKQLSRKNSFKQSENGKPDSSKARLGSKTSPNANISVSGIVEGMPKRGIPEHVGGDTSKPQGRGIQNQHPRYQSRIDNVDNGTQPNKAMESCGKNRRGTVGTSLDSTPEANGSFPGKGLPTTSQENGTKQLAAPPRKDGRRQKSNAIPDLNDKQKDSSLTGSSDGYQRRIESSSDENSCSYSKYEKDEPELKGPIKDDSQCKEYVDEFEEKYPVYISLNKILESYSEEFLKYQSELGASKGKDMERYYAVERQVRESYRLCGERFKRLKKTFLVLHDELQHLKRMIYDYASPYVKDL